MSFKEKINLDNLPRHIAVIMDGNGRWAKQHGAIRTFGHKSAIKSVREVAEASAELGVKYLTLYTFSTENWSRPKEEVSAIMQLLAHTISRETKTLIKNDIRLEVIGDMSGLPKNCQNKLNKSIESTRENKSMVLSLALNYSGRWEIVEAVKRIAQDVTENQVKIEEINESLFNNYLTTNSFPDPELLIRTSGEMRISNFLLWQLAYSEIYVTKVLWPDFTKEHLYEAIVDYQNRERRFGMTGEQIKKGVIQ